MKLYRRMLAAADGKPLAGDRFGMLGVRPKGKPGRSDVDAALPTDVVPAAAPKGMSVNADATRVPQPAGDEFVLWVLDVPDDNPGAVLGGDLAVEPDRPPHAVIRPARDLPLAEYQRALTGTRDHWQRVPEGDGP
ncbi:MAG: hypothetical protein C0501_14765 [Isosphaera sp.]|nr:hypothetical protein [Isosphaera sp.]